MNEVSKTAFDKVAEHPMVTRRMESRNVEVLEVDGQIAGARCIHGEWHELATDFFVTAGLLSAVDTMMVF